MCGGRYYKDRRTLYRVLDALDPPATVIIAGGATGADSMAVDWARERGVPNIVFAADWERYGKAAGPVRNAKMLLLGRPDRVIAFPGDRGTQNMIDRSRLAGVPVTEV